MNFLLYVNENVSKTPMNSFLHSIDRFSRQQRTFKPHRNIPEGTKQHDLMQHAQNTLGSGNLRLAVQLPEGEDLNEWIAVNSKTC